MEEITHLGKVVEVGPEYTTVEIISSSACAECHASGLCGISEYTTKAVQVPTKAFDSYAPGDEVNVVLKASMGHKAVWVAYVVPLIVLIAVLMSTLYAGCPEIVSALAAIAAVAVYYLAVFAFKDKLRNEYVFEIKHMDN